MAHRGFFIAKDGNGGNFKVGAEYDSINGIYYPSHSVATLPFVVQFLDSVGDGSGVTNFIGDYSGGVTDMSVAIPAGETWHVNRITGSMRYTGNLRADRFGDAELPNGIRWIVKVDGVEKEFTTQVQGKHLAAHAQFLGSHLTLFEFGSGDNFATWDAKFPELSGVAIALHGDDGDKFIIRLADNHTDLLEHRYILYGHKLVGS